MEGAPHTAKTIVCCPLGCPLPPYIKEGRRRPTNKGGRQGEGSPTRTPVLVGFGPTLFSFYRRGKRGRRGRGEGKGGAPPFLVQFGLPIRRGRGCPLWAASPLPYGPCRPNLPPGCSGNLPVLRKNARITWNHSDVRMQPSNI